MTTKNLFQSAIARTNDGRPPVWFMRQAGRYHSHYQKLREQHTFMDLCKKPELAAEVAMGPIQDFDFDAAILFSDLLFPLEAMGMGLKYVPAPQLDWHVRSPADLRKLKGGGALAIQLSFQAEALRLTRARLPVTKGLLGFVGGPLTLFFYAVSGSHQGNLADARNGVADGLFEGFCELLADLLVENMVLQAKAGADTIAVLDTCAGEISPDQFTRSVVPWMGKIFERFTKLCPDVPITYYSKGTNRNHWKALDPLPISCLGIDWFHDIARVLTEWGPRYAIQGNIDPSWLHHDPRRFEIELRELFSRVKALPPSARRGWICGLGHGVLQKTPESNVKLFLKIQKEIFE